ncbi:tetratricopeptide repeat protein [bacterium]|nr:tetratricopeptide repeat protein [bacterium]
MKKVFILLALLLVLTLVGGCAYYNTFYNAKKLFADASSQDLEASGRASRAAQQQYNDVIKKCASLIEFYPNSKYVDDAIYLMAQSFYRKGGSTTQVFEQCDKLIQYFPNSEFYTDAIVLKAQTNRDLNRISEAYSLLESQIISPKSQEDKAKVLLKIADFYTEDQEFERARFYLNTIIEEHKSTPEFKQASYFIGLNYLAENNYAEAIKSLERFLRIKNDREIKYDARYYIGLSNYHLKNYSTAIKQVEKLLEDEYRRDEKNKTSVLLGKILLADGQEEAGIEVLNDLIEGNQRGQFSAETNYVLGDYYLTNTDSLALAIKHFNEVKKADTNSPFVESSVAKSSVASQIQLFRDDNSQLEPKQLINEQFKLAEYYLDIMQLPDSALVVYDNIISNKDKFIVLKDSLNIKLDSLNISLGDLSAQVMSMNNEIDSLRTLVLNTNTLADSLTADSLKSQDPNGQRMLALESEKDSLNIKVDVLRRDSLSVDTRLKNIDDVLIAFDEEYIPFASFVKAFLYVDTFKEPSYAYEILTFLQENYPQSKYTYTIENYLNKGSLKLTTREKEISLQKFEEASRYLLEDPDTTIVLLEAVLDTLETDELIKAKMALGYLYYAQDDTLSARRYFQDLVENYSLAEDQTKWVKIFFSDNKINKLESLVFDVPDLESRIEDMTEADSLNSDEENDKLRDELEKEKEEKEKEEEIREPQMPLNNTPPPPLAPGAIDK